MNLPTLPINHKAAADQKAEQLRFVLLVLFACSLPYNIFYSQVVLAILVATTLMGFRLQKLKSIPGLSWVCISIYLLGLVGYIYSTNKAEAGNLLGRQATILLIPLLLPLAVQLSKSRRDVILRAFSCSNALAVIFLLANVFFIIRSNHLPYSAAFSDVFLNHQFSKPIGIHATYFSLYLGLSLIYQVHGFFKPQGAIWRIVSLAIVCILLTGLFFLASRSILIGTFLILVFLMPLFNMRKKALYTVVAGLLVVCSMVLVSKVDYFHKRFGNELVRDVYSASGSSIVEGASAEPRIERWKGAVELIKRSPLIGYGTGDEVKMLRIKYAEHLLVISLYSNFNAHNQYLSYALKNGLPGLAVFLAIFAYLLYLGISRRDVVYTSFLILLLIAFITENILDSNKGIFFFAFFNTLFAYTLAEKQGHKKSGPVEEPDHMK